MPRSSAPASTLIALFLATAGCGNRGTGATGTGTGGGAAAASSSTGTGGATPSSSAGAGGSTSASTGGGGGSTPSKWPDTTATIAVLADQLPDGMTSGQQSFAATHFVGSQKLTLDISQPLRAINPKFLVLHYHLSIWQSAPAVDFIINGTTWGNDYPTVTTHETWFWHNQQSQRIASTVDGKILMNLTDPGFAAYWESSLEQQVAAGQYDGIFFDSASPALLQAEVGGQDPRLAGTGARDTAIAEWGGETYIQGWEAWIKPLNDDLAAKGIPLIPNTGPFVTGWDNTNYSLTAGIFSEGYADPSFVETDWEASTNELLSLAGMGKIMILQNYLDDYNDVATRLYYLANYLLVKAGRTYLDYFYDPNNIHGALEWYPEWALDLGAPMSTATTVADLLQGGVYRRDFAKGSALVNPSTSPVTVTLGATMQEVVPQGGGAIDTAGDTPGTITMMQVTSVTVPATGAVILLN
jgi:Hypothetical glycosyl hydrolase family 15